MPEKVEKSLLGRALPSEKMILNDVILHLATKLIFYYLCARQYIQEVFHG
jgi:hypothetical protein